MYVGMHACVYLFARRKKKKLKLVSIFLLLVIILIWNFDLHKCITFLSQS